LRKAAAKTLRCLGEGQSKRATAKKTNLQKGARTNRPTDAWKADQKEKGGKSYPSVERRGGGDCRYKEAPSRAKHAGKSSQWMATNLEEFTLGMKSPESQEKGDSPAKIRREIQVCIEVSFGIAT